MADDYAGDASTSGRLPIGGSVSGVLETVGDTDWFAVSLVPGLHYQFTRSAGSTFVGSANLLTEKLVTSNGGLIYGNNSNGVISFQATMIGTYYLSVSDSSGTGPYTITSAPADDYAGDSSTIGTLSDGGSKNGVLESAGDVDWFAVSLIKGLHYQYIISAGPGFVGSANLLTDSLVAGNGGVYTTSNSNGTNGFTATLTGTVYLAVSDSSGTGSYTLIAAPLDDYTGDSSTSGRVLDGGTSRGVLETAGDVDDFAVSVVAGRNYNFTVSASAGFAGSANLLSVSLNNQSGGNIRSSSSGTISYTATTTGTLYLAVSDSSGTGSYTISSTTVIPGVPVYRFFDSKTGTQFLTSNVAERDTVISTRPDLVNEGIGLEAAAQNDTNGAPVYRFFDTIFGTHFFTSSATERDTIQLTRSDLTYEGPSFNEYATQQPNSTPVYRFFDSNRGTHFFTSSESERANIIATRSDLKPEGISFYAPTT